MPLDESFYFAALEQIIFNADRSAFERMIRDRSRTTQVSLYAFDVPCFHLQRPEQRAIRRTDDMRVDGCLSGLSESWDFPRFFGLCGSTPAQKSELRAHQMARKLRQLAFAAVFQPPLCFSAIVLVIGSSPSLFFLVLGYFLVWPYCPYVVCIAVAVLAVLSLRGTPWFPYRRYAGNSTFEQHKKVSPPLGHWNLGTMEPQVHREEKGHRPENREWAPTRGTVFFFQVTPWQSLAVSPLRASLPSRSWRLRRPGWCTLVAGTVFGLLFFRRL